MKILISGANGLIGSALAFALTGAGHQVNRLVREAGAADKGDVVWDPAAGKIDARAVAPFDAVFHLAGESIASGRWNDAKKERIYRSRVDSTNLLAKTVAGHSPAGKTLIVASAVGFYGNRGDEVLDEASVRGRGDFLSDVCHDWEHACQPAVQAGARVVNTRFGVVLSDQGGALKQMLTPFLLGAGGRIGSGRQWMSWVAIDDVVGALVHCLTTGSLSGPVNVVAPNPATNQEFTKTLGRVINRPTIFPMPAPVARLAFGQMADELLLASQRVKPAKLEAADYKFRFPRLEGALRHVLHR